MIAIVDYKVGNLGSVMNMFKKIDVPAVVTSDPEEILKADGVLFPGIGRFDFAMDALQKSNLIPVLTDYVFEKKKPLLGICVGYQMLAEHSEEGDCAGLGWFPAQVKKFQFSDGVKMRVPHMGWNTIRVVQADSPGAKLLHFDDPESRFYFAHSYFVQSKDPTLRLAQTDYGHTYDSALCRGNLFGVQFHPEKSHRFGMQLFRNFGNLVQSSRGQT